MEQNESQKGEKKKGEKKRDLKSVNGCMWRVIYNDRVVELNHEIGRIDWLSC
jgi:hypothetical protein